MTSISWNDMNDSSQLSQASSDQGHKNKNDDKSKTTSTLGLQKTLSSPQQPIKSGKFDNAQKIAENLQKLAQHTGTKIWLYIPDVSNNREIFNILKNLPEAENVIEASKGYHLLIKKQFATKLIQKGHYQKGFNLKFMYSNKNQPKQNKQLPKKGIQKKYSEKYPDSKNDDLEQIKSPRTRLKQNYQKQEQKVEKKKVKYIAKDTIQKKIQDGAKNLQQIAQKHQQSNKQSSPEKILSKDSENSQNNQTKQIKKPEIQQKIPQIPQQVKEKSIQKQKNQTKDKKSQVSEQQQQIKQKQKDKPKNKKKKDKKKAKDYFDPNNPFSALG